MTSLPPGSGPARVALILASNAGATEQNRA
jgi:hypothetical protein